MNVATLVLPVFAVILSGWVAGATGYLPRDVSGPLIAFAYRIAMPALVFLTIAPASFGELIDTGFLLAFGGGSMVVFTSVAVALRVVGRRGLAQSAMLAGSAAMTNTGFVALPILQAIYGAEGVVPAAVATVFVGVVMFPVLVALLEAGKDRGVSASSVPAVMRQVLINPVMLSAASGLAWSLFSLPLPGAVAAYGALLGGALTPCALFAIGLGLSFAEVKQVMRMTLLISTTKLIVMPMAVLGLCLVLDLDELYRVAAVICAAVPTAKTAYVLASTYDVEASAAGATIALTTLLSIATLLFWLVILI